MHLRCVKCLSVVFQIAHDVERYEHKFSIESRTVCGPRPVTIDFFFAPTTITLHPDAETSEVYHCIYLLHREEVYWSDA